MVREVHRIDAGHFEPGLLMPVASFHAPEAMADEMFSFDSFEDDLDSYVAAFFLVDGTLASVQRHAGNPADEFSVQVDTQDAEKAEAVACALLREFEVPGPISWDDLYSNFQMPPRKTVRSV